MDNVLSSTHQFIIGHAHGMYYLTRVATSTTWWCIFCKHAHTLPTLKYDYVYCWALPVNKTGSCVERVPTVTTISSCRDFSLAELATVGVGSLRCVVCLQLLRSFHTSRPSVNRGQEIQLPREGADLSVEEQPFFTMWFLQPVPTVTRFMTCSEVCARAFSTQE
jgi:hypothetical protein